MGKYWENQPLIQQATDICVENTENIGKNQRAAVSEELLCTGPSRAPTPKPSPALEPLPQRGCSFLQNQPALLLLLPEMTKVLFHPAHFMGKLINKCFILEEKGNF